MKHLRTDHGRGAQRTSRSTATWGSALLLLTLASCGGSSSSGGGDDVVPNDGQVALTGVTPAMGTTYGGTRVTLHGKGFTLGLTGPNEVRFGALQAAEVQVLNDTTLTAIVPEGTPGADVMVTVGNSAGMGALEEGFRYLVPAEVKSDLDGDEIADLVMASPFEGDPVSGMRTGAVFVVRGGVGGGQQTDRNSNQAEVRVVGEGDLDRFGASIATDDLNGDGVDDLVVGAPHRDAPSSITDHGAVYVFYGPFESPRLTPAQADVILTGETNRSGDRFGSSVAIGDVDGDGTPDLLVGAIGHDGPLGLNDTGAVYVFSGAAGFSSGSAADRATARFIGEFTGDAFGSQVVAADIDGDGLAELIVAAPLADPWLPAPRKRDAGAVYVFRGGAHLVMGGWNGSATSAELMFTGDAVEDEFGTSIAAGDITGDGTKDLIVGAPENDFLGFDVGRVYVFEGGSEIAGGAGAQVAKSLFSGQPSNDSFGEVVTCGDTNADGFEDLVIGAPRASFGAVRNGRTYIFFGAETMPDAVATMADLIHTGEATAAEGFGTCARVLDWNRDGMADVAASAPGNDASGPSSGRVYVFRGAQHQSSRAALDCDTILTGEAPGCFLGTSLANGQ